MLKNAAILAPFSSNNANDFSGRRFLLLGFHFQNFFHNFFCKPRTERVKYTRVAARNTIKNTNDQTEKSYLHLRLRHFVKQFLRELTTGPRVITRRRRRPHRRLCSTRRNLAPKSTIVEIENRYNH